MKAMEFGIPPEARRIDSSKHFVAYDTQQKQNNNMFRSRFRAQNDLLENPLEMKTVIGHLRSLVSNPVETATDECEPSQIVKL